MSKTWFITGASSGFGRELTELLLQRGDRVAATVRKSDALQDLVTKYGDRLWVAVLDVTDSSAIRTVLDRAFTELQRIDVVVSNAGYALFGAAEEVSDAQIERQLNTNLFGSSFFILTGIHGTHVLIGIVWLVALWGLSMQSRLSQGDSERVEIAGLYWHFVDVVWIVIFTVIYLLPR